MKLLRLELKNFRQHRHTQIQFESGLTGIVGANGAGKTTLIEAIAFAFFGSKAIRGKVADLKTRSQREGKLEVHLTFEQNEVIYSIIRSSSDARLFVGGESVPLVEGNREVISRIQVVLGMNYEEFVSTFLTEQKGIEFLSGREGATERERFIVRMLGYDRLEKVQEKLRVDKRDLKNTLLGYEASIGDRLELEKKYKQESEALRKVEPEYDMIIAQVEKLSSEVAKCKNEFGEKESRRLVWVKAQRELEHLQIRHVDRGKRLKEIEDRISVLRGHLSIANKSGIESLINEYKKQRENVTWAKKRKEEILSRKSSLEKLGVLGRCPTCNQELGAAHDSAISELVMTLSDIESEIQEYEDIDSIDRKLSILQEEVSLSKELSVLRDEIVVIDGDIKRSSDKVKEARFSESEYHAVKGRYDATSELLEIARLQKVKLEGEVKTKQALLERTVGELQSYDQRLEVIARQRHELLILEEGDLVLTDFRKALNEEIKPKLSTVASEFMAALTDGRYVNIGIGSDFTPYIVEDGTARNVISGGEGDILHLSVRLALSHMLAERSGQQFSLLIPDEIFGSLDESRRNNVLHLLERLGDRFDQILVITHMDDIKEGVEHLLTVDFDEGSEFSTVNMQSLEDDGVWL